MFCNFNSESPNNLAVARLRSGDTIRSKSAYTQDVLDEIAKLIGGSIISFPVLETFYTSAVFARLNVLRNSDTVNSWPDAGRHPQ